MKAVHPIERVETARLVCERLRMDHLADVSRLLRDPRISGRMWPGHAPPSEQEVAESIADKERHWARYGYGLWLLRDRRTGEAIGRGGLQWTKIAGLDEVEAGWAIVPERWGEGLATELALASAAAGFGRLGIGSIIAFTLPGNLASRRVMDKSGFEYERDIVHAGLGHVLYRRRAPER